MIQSKKYCTILLIIMLHIPKSFEQEGRILKDMPEECFSFKELDDDTRLFNNPENVPTSKADDLDLESGWYRIMGKKANSLSQGFKPPMKGSIKAPPNFCGTVYPGTLMGDHPTVTEGLVEMTVCFRSKYCFFRELDECQCKFKKTIYVRNCLKHFIYWLTPTGRQQRYCTGSLGLEGPETTETASYAIECRQFKVINDFSRQWSKIAEVKSDDAEGWNKFGKQAGLELASDCKVSDEEISRKAQPCGAAFRGYLMEKHPTVKDGRVNRRVCFSYTQSCKCQFFSSIDVRNCGSFFVYRLKPPPLKDSRYCGALELSAKTDIEKPAIQRNLITKDLCASNYNVRHDPDRLWSYTSPTVNKCDAHFYGLYRFGSKYTPWSIMEGCNKKDMLLITHRCGAKYQGYMEGRHPMVSEKYVQRIICFQEADTPCECAFNAIIGVQNCSGYYVYDLRGVPKCHARFCMVANKTTAIKVDPGLPPAYNIPLPGHKPVVAEKLQSNEEGDSLVLSTTVLSVVLLIVLLILVILVIILIVYVRPLYFRHKRKLDTEDSKPKSDTPNKKEDSNSDDSQSPKWAPPKCNGNIWDYNADGYKHLPSEPPNDNEASPSYSNLPPRPSRAPPIEQPHVMSPDLPPMPSEDDNLKISPVSDKSFPDLPEEVKIVDDKDKHESYPIRNHMNNNNIIRKVNSDERFDSEV